MLRKEVFCIVYSVQHRVVFLFSKFVLQRASSKLQPQTMQSNESNIAIGF